MTAAFVVASLLVGAVIVASAELLHRALVSWQRPTRWVWAAALGLMLVLGARLALVRAPRPAVSTAGTAPAWLSSADASSSAALGDHSDSFGALEAQLRAGLQRVASRSPAVAEQALLWALLIVPTVSIGVLIASFVRMSQAKRRWGRAVMARTAVRVSRDAGPAVVGLAPMEIVVPEWLVTRDPRQQAVIIRHEREHIDARDPWLLVAACVGVAAMPWNPAMWFALSRLRLAIELDCDRRVLAGDVTPLTYGQLLLDITERAAGARTAFPVLAYRGNAPSHLETRIRTMSERVHRWAPLTSAAATGVGIVAILAACEAKLPTAAQIDALDAKGAAAMLDSASRGSARTSEYVVDGHAVDSDSAARIAPSRIAKVAVRRPARDRNIVEITTRERSDTLIEAVLPDRSDSAARAGVERFRAAFDSAVTRKRLDAARRDSGEWFASVRLDSLRLREAANMPAGFARKVELCSTTAPARCQEALVIEQSARPRQSVDSILKSRAGTNAPHDTVNTFNARRDSAQTLAASRSRAPEPLVVIDGVMVDGSRLNSINPNDIESIEVIKGPLARRLYPVPNAENGIIAITLKRK